MEGLFQNVKPKSKELYIANITRLSNALAGTDRVDLNHLDFLEDIDKVSEYLSSKYAQTTIRSYFIAICSLLNELPKYKTLYDKYYKILISKNKELETNNTKSEKQKENWISQAEVLEKQKEVEGEAIDTINKSTTNVFRQREWNTILEWVILSLYTLIPPRRSIDYTLMNVVNDVDLDANTDLNYWVRPKKKFIFTNYKTAGTYSTQIVNIPNDLDVLLNAYLDLRKDKEENDIPLLVEHDLTPIRENYRITKFLNRVFDGKKISVDMLRNIYLTTNFKDNHINLKNAAEKMGTSSETIQNHYIKIDEEEEPTQSIKTAKKIVIEEEEKKEPEPELKPQPIRSPSPPPVEKKKRGRPKKSTETLKEEKPLKKKTSKKRIIDEED
jgi:hypothetical protein